MKLTFKILSLLLVLFAVACGDGKKEEKEQIRLNDNEPTSQAAETTEAKTSEIDPMETKGVGPIKEVDLSPTIDEAMAARGEATFKQMCTACHKTDKKFIGPAISGVTERRTPEWIMNMILNPTEMVQKDPLAKQLLMEHNGSPMANQNLSEEQARAILEYFRQLDEK
ncbi:c-type cytochrome [Salinimicrobium soli]|uniref:c-type cytochrome n=1 Tax=Salinimicrobium soli TaxID=1254399 RepID=UPI003AB0D8D7